MILRTALALLAIALEAQTNPDTRRQEASTLAAALLSQTDAARQAVAHHDPRAAQGSVRQAMDLAARIETLAAQHGQPVVVTISSDFAKQSTIVPAGKRDASISQVSGAYTATRLNITNAQVQLEAARSALQQSDLKAADADLAAVQASVVTRNYTGDMPVMQARENLAIAQSRVRQGAYKDAILPLKSASRALDRFAQQMPKPQQSELAERMKLDIDAYADRILHDHSDALDRINGWYSQVTDWYFWAGVP
jgi:hypothetical protein